MHPIFDPLVGFGLDRFGTPLDGVHPLWWCRAVDSYFERWNEQWVKRMTAADQAGAGLIQQWAAPGTSTDKVLRWFDDTISSTPRGPLSAEHDFVSTFLVDVRTEEVGNLDPDETLTGPQDRLLAKWEGTRLDWWREGRDRIAAAIPAEHQGLGLVVNAASRVMLASP